MSEKELEMEELEPDRVTLTDEEGVERDFDIISTLELDGNEYFALVAVDGAEGGLLGHVVLGGLLTDETAAEEVEGHEEQGDDGQKPAGVEHHEHRACQGDGT